MVLLALAFFTAGAIISALAHNFTVLLVGRSIQGVGGGGIIALTYVIVTDLVTLRDRGKWFGLISMMYAIGSVSGYGFLLPYRCLSISDIQLSRPVIGGALAETVSWVRLCTHWCTRIMSSLTLAMDLLDQSAALWIRLRHRTDLSTSTSQGRIFCGEAQAG